MELGVVKKILPLPDSLLVLIRRTYSSTIFTNIYINSSVSDSPFLPSFYGPLDHIGGSINTAHNGM